MDAERVIQAVAAQDARARRSRTWSERLVAWSAAPFRAWARLRGPRVQVRSDGDSLTLTFRPPMRPQIPILLMVALGCGGPAVLGESIGWGIWPALAVFAVWLGWVCFAPLHLTFAHGCYAMHRTGITIEAGRIRDASLVAAGYFPTGHPYFWEARWRGRFQITVPGLTPEDAARLRSVAKRYGL